MGGRGEINIKRRDVPYKRRKETILLSVDDNYKCLNLLHKIAMV